MEGFLIATEDQSLRFGDKVLSVQNREESGQPKYYDSKVADK